MLDRGIWEHERQKYPAGSPIPWDEAIRLRIPEATNKSDGGGASGPPPPSHAQRPGVETRPPPSRTTPHPRPTKKAR